MAADTEERWYTEFQTVSKLMSVLMTHALTRLDSERNTAYNLEAALGPNFKTHTWYKTSVNCGGQHDPVTKLLMCDGMCTCHIDSSQCCLSKLIVEYENLVRTAWELHCRILHGPFCRFGTTSFLCERRNEDTRVSAYRIRHGPSLKKTARRASARATTCVRWTIGTLTERGTCFGLQPYAVRGTATIRVEMLDGLRPLETLLIT